MRVFLALLICLACQPAAAETIRPVVHYPILGSEYQGDECSIQTNLIVVLIDFSPDGEITRFDFVLESTIPEMNAEAKETLLEDGMEDVWAEDYEKYSKVTVVWSVPCYPAK